MQDRALSIVNEVSPTRMSTWSFIHDMEQHGSLPNVVTYDTLINTHCKSGRTDAAYEVLLSMSLKGLESKVILYNVIGKREQEKKKEVGNSKIFCMGFM
ncbi:uncharacterized protein J3R85_003616 [Psidium guajava]|nr:uncharacterized protein J3R85_003616 [Psidium guajava]